MIKTSLYLCVALAAMTVPSLAATPVPLENASFEEGLKGWRARAGEGMFSVVPEAAAMGKTGLSVVDADARLGGGLMSAPFPVQENHNYQLSFWGRMDGKNPGTNVKLEFYDAAGGALKGTAIPRLWGGAGVKYAPGFESYSCGIGAPAGATQGRVVVETWGKATSETSMDDFRVDDITDGVPPVDELEPLIQVVRAARAGGQKMPKIVIKMDDLKHVNDRIYPRWKKYTDFLLERKIKGGVGIVFESLETDAPKYIAWIKGLHETGLVEFWNHGYDHKEWKVDGKSVYEFHGSGYEHQKKQLTRSNQLAREKLGITMRTFGAPFNMTDANAAKVLEEDPDIQVVLYGPIVKGKVLLPRLFSVNTESPTLVANYPELVRGFARNMKQPVLVLQGHPNNWGDDRWENFVKIVDFLQMAGAEFVHARDLANKAQLARAD